MRASNVFKASLFSMAVVILSSCSKDDSDVRGPEANLKSVDGTEWIAKNAKISFYNGKYSIDCSIPGNGTYTQNGSHIKFNGQKVSIGAGYVSLEEGEISKYGDQMTISVKDASYWNTGEIEKITFVYNIINAN